MGAPKKKIHYHSFAIRKQADMKQIRKVKKNDIGIQVVLNVWLKSEGMHFLQLSFSLSRVR